MTTADGVGISGIEVTLTKEGGGRYSATTDSNGQYSMTVTEGTYTGVGYYKSRMYSLGSRRADIITLEGQSFTITEPTEINYQLPFDKVNIHVVDHEGNPAPNVQVSFSANRWHTGNQVLTSSGAALNMYNNTERGEQHYTNDQGIAEVWVQRNPTTCIYYGCSFEHFFSLYPQHGSGLVDSFRLTHITDQDDITLTLDVPLGVAGNVGN